MPKDLTPEQRQQRNATLERWKAQNMRQIKFRLSHFSDADILEVLDALPNVQGYLKRLIRDDIARGEQAVWRSDPPAHPHPDTPD